ncbi:MAG: 30S ribosomal protein S16 [Candidatus Omnitrophota bacterium]|nr:30S ribosomal protein S16 [Candidatus Omnitrophota bacterium]
MAEVMIRLKRLGGKKKPHNRIVVITKTKARDSRAIEELGYYDASKNPLVLKLNVERANYWISKGATPSPTVKQLIKKAKEKAKAQVS